MKKKLAVLKITRAKAQNIIFAASALNISGTELRLWQRVRFCYCSYMPGLNICGSLPSCQPNT
jgi:hypothetical protein